MRLRLTVIMMTTLGGALVACGDGSAETALRRSATTTGAPAITAAPSSTSTIVPCDRAEALSAVIASGAAEGGGHIDYLKCLDGFGWALYGVDADTETAHVILSVKTDGYQVLNLGTSLCPLDSRMPAEVAMAIAPSRAAANDCPEPGSSGG